MAKNLRALTDSELRYMLDKYSFDVFEDKYIVVKCLSRKTLHEIGKQFALSTPIRKVAISPLAIKMWLEQFRSEYSLIEVQNAISVLIITYQSVSPETVLKQMKRKSIEIKKV